METGRLPEESFDEPEPKEFRIRVDPETYQRISENAKAKGVSMSQIVRQAVGKMIQ